VNLFIPERNALYTLLGPACDNAPNSCRIALEHCTNFFHPGERVTFNKYGIMAGHDKFIDFSHCQRWQPEKLSLSGEQKAWNNVAELIYENINNGPSLFNYHGDNLFYQEIKRLLQLQRARLLAALKRDDRAVIKNAAVNLMGLGTGLTPTGDDYLTGLSIILFITGSPALKYRATFRAALEAGKEQTTLLSAITLREALAGRYREVIYRLVAKLCRNELNAIQQAINDIQQIGSSSGSDMLYGMADALALTANSGGRDVRTDCD
jgi:hypothetical protein